MATATFIPTSNGYLNNLIYAVSNCLDFDGTDDLVEIPDGTWNSFGSSNFTVEMLVYKKASSSGWTNSAAVGKWNTGASAGTNEWLLALTSSGSDDYPTFNVEVGSTTYSVTSSVALSLNTWTHIAGVRNGTSIMIYVDGTLRGTTTDAGITTINDISGRVIQIGKIAGASFYTAMRASNLRLWSVARSSTQISAHTLLVWGNADTNLLATYPMVQGTAGGTNTGITTLDEWGSSSRTGTLTGFALTGSSSNWILYGDTATSNWQSATTLNYDQTFMYSNSSGAKLEFYNTDWTTLPSSITISQVTVSGYYRRTRASSNELSVLKFYVRVGSTNYNTNTAGPPTDQRYTQTSHVWTTNPATGLAWTRADLVAGVQMGFGCTVASGGQVRFTQIQAVVTYELLTASYQGHQMFILGA